MKKSIASVLSLFMTMSFISTSMADDKISTEGKLKGEAQPQSTDSRNMAAFVISEVEVLDEAGANQYKPLASASIAAYGGRYVVRGAKPDVVEGKPTNRMIIIAEFPSMQRLREWYASPEYAKALKFRKTALDRRLMFVEGLNPQAEPADK